MNVIPAIDLRGGRCVRLYQGDFARETEYSGDPLAVAGAFVAFGFDHLHVVDLDGAKSGTQQNRDIARVLASTEGLRVQLGGGIRAEQDIRNWLDAGIDRCVIGSRAVTAPDTVRDWLRQFGPDRIVLAFDVRIDAEPRLTTHGWTKTTDVTLWQCIDYYLEYGLKNVLCTDVERDGAMTGPNLDLYERICARYPSLGLQASGGVRHMRDLRKLRDAGATAAITGRALLDGAFSAEEMQPFLRGA